MAKKCENCGERKDVIGDDTWCQHCLKKEWTGGSLAKALKQLEERRNEEKKG